MIADLRGSSLKTWKEWLDKELTSPGEHVKKHPDMFRVLLAFRELIDKTEMEQYNKQLVELMSQASVK